MMRIMAKRMKAAAMGRRHIGGKSPGEIPSSLASGTTQPSTLARVRTHSCSQKVKMAARVMARKKTVAQRSKRVAMRGQSLRRPNMISTW